MSDPTVPPDAVPPGTVPFGEPRADQNPFAHRLFTLRLALRLARRELRGGLKGFWIFLGCLALGVAAIAAVQSVSSGLKAGLVQDGRVILGGDVAVRQLYTPPTPEQRADLVGSARSSTSAEMRGMARALDESRSSLVELKAVDDPYPLYGAVTLTGGASLAEALAERDGLWGAVVEASLTDRLGVAVGDRLRLGDRVYRVAGVLDREPDRASSNAFSLGPRLLVSLASLEGTGLLQPGSLVWWTVKIALPPGTDARDWQAAVKARFPNAPWTIRDLSSASPQIERFIERMTLFLTLVGLTALLVGGVGVGNAVRSHLESRARTIAMLKCVGAPGALVFQLYLVQILALAVLGVVAGLALGALAPLALGHLLDGVLPVTARIGIYPGALALAALYGLLTALAFSLWPLGRAREVPAGALFRDAITPARGRPRAPYVIGLGLTVLALAGLAVATADNKPFALWFVGGSIATFALFRGAAALITWGAARVGRVRRPGLRLALANLHRPGNPTGAVVLSLGLGLTVLVAVAQIEANFARRVSDTIPKDAPAFFFVDIQRDQFAALRDTVTAVPGTSAFEAVPSLRGRIERVNGTEAEKALVNPEQAWILAGDRGITYSATPPEHSQIVKGQWWPTDYRGPPLISIHQSVADAFNIGPGARLTVNILGRSIEATVASVRAAEFSTMTINFTMVFAPGTLEGAPQTWIATVRATPESEAAVQKAVLSHFSNITLVRVKDALDTVAGMLGNIGTAVRVVAAITLVAGTLVLAGAVAAGHRRRVYDAVVLKVLGATRADVLRAFLVEYGLLGLLTAAIAGVIGTLTAWAVLLFLMRWDWAFQPMAVIGTALLSTAITLAFGFFGTWRALGQPAAPLLRNE
ncbi:ABC transporter permease [Azospirillum griseum]|uniref:ABC transporter permease n=1 Tax=Azospirillum griseum TaxID=2496639 RepID=UPI0015761EAA|nr:FtsX-like permease family protein [Azospirillum griseum]